MAKQYIKALVTKVNDDTFSLDVAIASTPTPDRQGESIAPTAWRLENFKKNPVFLWAHDYSKPPLGKVTNLHMKGDSLMFTPVFAGHLDDFSLKIYKMFREGFLNAFSVGFNPQSRPKLIKNQNGDEVPTWTDVDLLEISAVPVPANPQALVMARSYLGDDEYTKLFKGKVKALTDEDLEGKIRIDVKDLALFDQATLRVMDIDEERGIEAVVGQTLDEEDGLELIQAYLFMADEWTEDEANEYALNNAPTETDAERAKRIITSDQEDKLVGALNALKLSADAINDVLKNADVVDNDATTATKARSETPASVLNIVRSEAKRATRSVERINRVIKVVKPQQSKNYKIKIKK